MSKVQFDKLAVCPPCKRGHHDECMDSSDEYGDDFICVCECNKYVPHGDFIDDDFFGIKEKYDPLQERDEWN